MEEVVWGDRAIIMLIVGYVLDCLPSLNEDWKTVLEQVHSIEQLNPKPTVIINMRVMAFRKLSVVI
jgi:hypothetical protein